ncbi:hypothetical protein D3H65_00780 [Paraflavitalea soli]|uniref:HAD family hydrolase n=1 Tax=Paraflavitalea soli TaxID=2315862 RepID=A0A3B7MHN9_9BACT|nr:hypothetical protein D3H65_00780 [Paraflavitalea soli]
MINLIAYKTQPVTEQPNATKLFQALRQRGILVVMNTGYDRHTGETLVKKIGWQVGIDYDGLVTASDVKANRPNPGMILWPCSSMASPMHRRL